MGILHLLVYVSCCFSFQHTLVNAQRYRQRLETAKEHALDGGKEQNDIRVRFVDQPDAPATWNPWSSPTPCSVRCGKQGFAEKLRTCSSGVQSDCEAQGGNHWEVILCNNGPCTETPHHLSWGSWTECSVSCGHGVHARFRNCSTHIQSDCTGAHYELQACVALQSECIVATTRPPTTMPTTTISAAWSAWQTEIACSSTCGAGFGKKTRTCSSGRNSDCSGQPWQVTVCNLGDCAKDGQWENWQSWTACSETCGYGQQYRARTCTYPDPLNKGANCPGDVVEVILCNVSKCTVDGVWTEWGSYTACSATCDDGIQARTRMCSFPGDAPHGENCAGDAIQTKTCSNQLCAADGSWAPWSSWSECTKSCNSGQKFRARVCVYDRSRPKGKACEGEMVGKDVCNTNPCAVDGVFSEWLPWTQCSHTCNGGRQSRIRVCTFDPSAPHGKDCAGSKSDSRSCGEQECAVDGIWGAWGAWVQCSETCGGGRTARTRSCDYRSLTAPHGRPCSGDGGQSKTCNTNLCPVDATWGLWTRYTSCSLTCGGGTRTRTRPCTYDPVAPLGRNCTGSAQMSQPCNTGTCPVDGSLTSWSPWSMCTVSCGKGTYSRARQCFFPIHVPHGDDCHGDLRETTFCNDNPCPTLPPTTTPEPTVPGHWSSWSEWTSCTVSCGDGTQTKDRVCTYPDHSLHGEYCKGDNTSTTACNENNCPVDGQWSTWSYFSRCSVTCGNGTHTRNRTCDYDPRSPHGLPCTGSDTETDVCLSGNCPVDGTWSTWEAWTTCPVTCGGGVQGRQRVCDYPSDSPHGTPCSGESHENRTCSTSQCPVDGTLGLWTSWTTCTVTCGNGTQIRNRTCDFPAGVPRGADCTSPLGAAQSCNDNLCPVDGVWSAWAEWATCSQTCGGGRQSRTRQCNYDSHAPHGALCTGASNEIRSCLNVTLCPVDGIWSGWTNWSACSVSCENGTQTRTRTCTFVDGSPHGKDCSGLAMETQNCDNGACPVDGVWSAWSTWTTCTVTCGNGTRTQNRSCNFPPGVPKGSNCTGPSNRTEDCNTNLCPVDGQFGLWSNWTSCSLTCGGGSRTRQRDCTFDLIAPHGNNCTGNYSDVEECNTENCPVDGVWSAWSNYTACTSTCGTGNQFRTRQCQFKSGSPKGDNCTGSSSQQQDCNTNLCPVDGKFSDWGAWSSCSKSCNNGTRSRNRTCEYSDPAPHGDPCVGSTTDDGVCHPDPCPIDGHWSDWSTYSTCSLSCSNGTQTRTRTCIFHDPAPHGAQCFGGDNQTMDCNTQPCPVDGVWSPWESWQACSVTCGKGKQVRGRICSYQAGVPKGADCTGDMSEAQDCDPGDCPVDGQLSAWSAWTECSVTCGDGVQFKARTCEFPDGKPHGDNCTGALSGSQNCSLTACPVDGSWNTWADWSTCTVTCGGGARTRNRTCEYSPSAPQGDPCVGDALQNDTCNTQQCPVDGTWGQWSTFSSCTKSCGNGTSTRTRVCEYSPAGAPHGAACPGDDTDVVFCNTTECAQDAVWSAWTTWTDCSVTCTNGTQTRDRTCSWPSTVHGENCTGDSTETRACAAGLCPVDGKWNEWGNWSACSATCNLGSHSRNRTCIFDALAPKGAACFGPDSQNEICFDGPCPAVFEWSDWSSWSTCSATCGSGTIQRSRICGSAVSPSVRSNNCTGDAMEQLPCNASSECPVDGSWGAWEAWGTCSATCGHADKTRTRTCEFDSSKPKGSDCLGQANETEPCHLPDCAVDGVWQEWMAWSACSVSCASGTRTRQRVCYFPPGSTHGANCTGPADDSEQCTQPAECPVDGVWGSWKSWGSCSATCGGGTHTRRRSCSFPPRVPQGEYCVGSGIDRGTCNNVTCSVDGTFQDWSTWSSCSVTCGNGTRTRNRTCFFPAGVTHGADCTGAADDSEACTSPNSCPVDGAWSTWKSWGTCNATCGGGTRTRRRSCQFPPHEPQGEYCVGSAIDRGDCNTDTCPVVTTTTPLPPPPRSCHVCESPNVCATRYTSKECPLDQQYCINELTNDPTGRIHVNRRCATRQECIDGWYDQYSDIDRCTTFQEGNLYSGQSFYCEFCCDTDNCNDRVNMDNKFIT